MFGAVCFEFFVFFAEAFDLSFEFGVFTNETNGVCGELVGQLLGVEGVGETVENCLGVCDATFPLGG